MTQIGLKRNQIKPNTLLGELFPRSIRGKYLRQILNDLEVKNDVALIRPHWMNNAILAGALGGGMAAPVYFAWHPVSSPYMIVNFLTASPILAGFAFAGLFGSICALLTRRMRYEFKPAMTTVAGLSRWIVANAPDPVQSPPGEWRREQVTEIVREIVIDQLGCENIYHENANFVKDLGLA